MKSHANSGIMDKSTNGRIANSNRYRAKIPRNRKHSKMSIGYRSDRYTIRMP